MTPSPTQAPRKTISDPEPLVVPPEYQANNLVELVARAVDTYPNNEAMRWKPSFWAEIR